MDKILITGVAGLIGSNLANYLLENEKNIVYGIDDFSSSTMSNLYPLLKNERFEFLEHNLKDNIPYCVDYIYHLAGNGDFSHYHNDKYSFILNQIEITKNIIEYTKSIGAKLILTTTFKDYQEKNKEFYPYYDCINLIEDIVLEAINKNKLNCTIARLYGVYGENFKKDDDRFIPKTILKALNNEDFTFDSDESSYFTYVKDVVLNLEKIMQNYCDKPLIDIVNQNLYLKSDVVKLIINLANSKSKITLNSSIQAHPNFNKPEIYKDFSCDTNIADGILNTIKNFKLLYFY